MKAILQLLFIIGGAGAALGQTQIVAPGGLVDTEGNSSSADLFSTTTARLQQVYSASDFTALGAPIGRIDAVSFRFDGTSAQNILFSRSVSMSLSTTTRSPDNLSPVFDENAGLDAVFVFGGQIGAHSASSAMPRPFDIRIPLAVPFYYEPAKGNLSLGMVTSGGASTFLLDAQLASDDGVGRVFGGNALSGTVDTLGLITQFEITPIPEPSTAVLFVFSTLLLSMWITIRKNRRQVRTFTGQPGTLE